MQSLVSIILPVYNGEKYLSESINSVIAQTYKNWELIVLDDCSTDNTPNIVKEYAEQDQRICYIRNQKNLRLPNNLNKGFSMAKGQYLTWTSDDNRFRHNAIETMVTTLQKNPSIEFVYASYQVIDDIGNNMQVLYAEHEGKNHILGSNVVGACFMYTRKAYEKIGDYDAELVLVEDFDYWQRMFMNFEATAINDVLYDYRLHANSLTGTKKEEEFGRVLEKMLLKNKAGFGKLNFTQKNSYYSCLYKSRQYQGKVLKYVIRKTWYDYLSRFKRFIRRHMDYGER